MSLVCPTCQAAVRSPHSRPGRFKTTCPACGGRFGVTIPADPAATWATYIVSEGRGLAASVVLDPPTRVAPPADRTPPPRTRSQAAPAESVPGAASAPGSTTRRTPDGMPTQVPGYQLERLLGRGGMGTVYLARQLSLDRPVALKVMNRKWAADPVFVARFTREAFAAALLNHPNVVQIFDIGEAAGLRFFSMEYVPGRTLADLVKRDGKLDCETAVGYVLQAARGLKHAHDRGMIHRDVKPDNLLVDDQGCVKVADLGLVKTPGTTAAADSPTAPTSEGLGRLPINMTGARMALGTPAYMAPEQCRDATSVDHRADIYSLGCTLYVLVTGRPPFDGTTAVELMTKHAYEPLVPPEVVASRVPRELSVVIQQMMEKNAADRFPNMGEVVRILEEWLGVHHAGTFSPRDDQIEALETQVETFHTAPAAVSKNRVITGSIVGCLLASVLLVFFGQLGWAFGLAGFVLQAAAAYFVLNGIQNRTYLFRRVRQFAFGLKAWDYTLAAAGVVLFGVMLWGLGLLGLWVGFGILATAAAVALRYGFDTAVTASRAAPLAATHTLLRKLRLQGLAEDEVRLFIAKYAGRNWEEFFEALFGYEAKITARAQLLRGGSAGVRDRFAAWRDPVIALIDRWEKARREARERTLLEAVEAARLVSTGMSGSAAHIQAAQHAADWVNQAGTIRRIGRATGIIPGITTAPNLAALFGTAPPPPIIAPRPKRDSLDALAGLIVGPPIRALAAGLFLGAFGLWVHQNHLLSGVPAPATVDEATAAATSLVQTTTNPLTLPGVPAAYTNWADSGNIGWAGALLFASLFTRGNRMGALVLVGAAVCAFGPHLGLRTVDPIRPTHVAFLLGSAFALTGYRLSRRG